MSCCFRPHQSSPFTLAEEAQTGEDHERDLGKLLEFLTSGSAATAGDIVAELSAYRRCAINGEDVTLARQRVEEGLLSVMCRTERPRVGDGGILAEEDHPVDQFTPEELAGWVALHELADVLDAPVSLEYWKSAPYFANFLDGYKVGEALRTRLAEGDVTPELRRALRRVQKLDAAAVGNREHVDLGNARLRALAARNDLCGPSGAALGAGLPPLPRDGRAVPELGCGRDVEALAVLLVVGNPDRSCVAALLRR